MDYSAGFSKLIYNSNILFYVTNGDGTILFLNTFGQKLLGITPEDIVDGINSISFYADPEDKNDLDSILKSKKSVFDIEIRMKSKDGRLITGHEYGYIQKTEKGEELICGLINDISDFIELNLSTARLNIEMAETNQKLQDAYNTMAQQEKMATIGELAAGVAHEINNPLGFIKSNSRSMTKYMEMITVVFKQISEKYSLKEIENADKMDFILSDIKEVLEENGDGLNRIAKITESLKRFARMGDEDVKSDFDLNQAVLDTLNIAKIQYKYIADIKLDLGEIPPVYCNGDSINQVLLNLIVNAAHAIEMLGSKERGVIVIKTSSDNGSIKFSVCDSGPGVEDSVAHKLFDPFFTTKEVGKGTGLGLSLCYDIIVQKHKGKIWFENCTPGGARFIFTLPGKAE
ncbi:MAG: ATP-binding protein [Spirochaetia bacterium]|jgi:two-component system NtrC family sensor kinase|nr:ATP-binding protein [Spirochaetia bacterium]